MGGSFESREKHRWKIIHGFILDVGSCLILILSVPFITCFNALHRRPNPNFSSRPSQPSLNRPKLPLLGGTVIISIIETHSSGRAGAGPSRVPKDRFLAELQERGKIGDRRLSDVVESLQFSVKWEPAKGALGVAIPSEYEVLAEGEMKVVSSFSPLCHIML